jgi:LysM repeat protein
MRLGAVSALIIITVFIGFKYGHRLFGRDQDKASVASVKANVQQETNVSEAAAPRPAPEPSRNLAQEPGPEPMLSPLIPEATSESNPRVAECIDEAVAMVNGKPAGIVEARDRLNEALSMPMNNVQRALIKKKLSELADEWLFSRSVFPQDSLCRRYKVEPGDLLSAIATSNRVPWDILMEVNKISRPELLRAGETIKVIHGPFHARVCLSTFTMDLYLQDTFVRSFRVGVGKPGRETPTGLWRVKLGGKMISPKWTDPDTHKTYQPDDPDYPLGSRWIALEGVTGEAKGRSGFAIHGTKKPDEIGTAGSRGCIRLYNGDVILVYNLLTPGLSRVEVVK